MAILKKEELSPSEREDKIKKGKKLVEKKIRKDYSSYNP